MHIEELDGTDIFLIHDFLSPEECEAFIARSEGIGYGDAPITTAMGPVLAKDVRNNERVMLDDPALAASLWERAAPLLPTRLRDWRGWRVVGLNERFRFYRYDPGQKFDLHADGALHRSPEEKSFLTFMVYLNDGFAGGRTLFFRGSGLAIRDHLAVGPRRGAALVFRHPILHEGEAVRGGRKYVLRTDVMYRIDNEERVL